MSFLNNDLQKTSCQLIDITPHFPKPTTTCLKTTYMYINILTIRYHFILNSYTYCSQYISILSVFATPTYIPIHIIPSIFYPISTQHTSIPYMSFIFYVSTKTAVVHKNNTNLHHL